jgi:hypothetical protein
MVIVHLLLQQHVMKLSLVFIFNILKNVNKSVHVLMINHIGMKLIV